MFEKWNGKIILNDKEVSKVDETTLVGSVSIRLLPKGYVESANKEKAVVGELKGNQEYIITVKSYMTQKSTEDFAFMKNFNNDIPMPLLTMVGTKEKESPKMWYMKLHGDIVEKVATRCMKCGKVLDNPVSKYFGMGPVCGHHSYTNPFDSQEELEKAVADYRLVLNQITWEGWIPKSAIVQERVRE